MAAHVRGSAGRVREGKRGSEGLREQRGGEREKRGTVTKADEGGRRRMKADEGDCRAGQGRSIMRARALDPLSTLHSALCATYYYSTVAPCVMTMARRCIRWQLGNVLALPPSAARCSLLAAACHRPTDDHHARLLASRHCAFSHIPALVPLWHPASCISHLPSPPPTSSPSLNHRTTPD